MKLQKLNLKNVTGIKGLINYKKIKIINKKSNDLKIDGKESNENNNNLLNKKEIKENEEKKNDEKIMNKTVKSSNTVLPRKKVKEISFKSEDNNKIEDKKENDNVNGIKELMRNFSSISKESTMYKTKKKFFSSSQLKHRMINDEEKNYSSIGAPSRKNSYMGRKIIRSFSANNIANNLGLGGGAFITGLNPFLNQRNGIKKISEKSSKSYFFNKIKQEKKFLTFFDIKKIYFLDKKVYKPNKEFESEVNRLKRNNSQEFITNFNFDSYKMTILNLFQKHVSYHNFDIMKKNFDAIGKGWKWKDYTRSHIKNKRRFSSSQTEREMIYNNNKIERENRIKSRSNNKYN